MDISEWCKEGRLVNRPLTPSSFPHGGRVVLLNVPPVIGSKSAPVLGVSSVLCFWSFYNIFIQRFGYLQDSSTEQMWTQWGTTSASRVEDPSLPSKITRVLTRRDQRRRTSNPGFTNILPNRYRKRKNIPHKQSLLGDSEMLHHSRSHSHWLGKRKRNSIPRSRQQVI